MAGINKSLPIIPLVTLVRHGFFLLLQLLPQVNRKSGNETTDSESNCKEVANPS